MIDAVTQYRNQLKRKLPCTPATRKLLLKNFDSMLNAYLEDHPSATAADIETAFGSSDEMVRILMDEVTSQEYQRYRRTRMCVRIIAAILLSVLTLFTIYIYFFKEIGLNVTSDVTEVTNDWDETYVQSGED